ncbi:Protein kinase, putative [Hondaea fermentalgiana]|uniref:mitogen-activated protein kinase kinase n=1 Tax=Hondaea fermentalgiana TaxID=2315210 RepID=A0A2R5GVF8_9STRA|nr:Protein kinase, putative [Hondaea fermentalgiana]|eukprot:GBG34827.1 Protein kinase, putative [Hondaea fermentalgiana]
MRDGGPKQMEDVQTARKERNRKRRRRTAMGWTRASCAAIMVAALALGAFLSADAKWTKTKDGVTISCEPDYTGTSYEDLDEGNKEVITCYQGSWLYSRYCTNNSLTETCVSQRTFGTLECASTNGQYTPFVESGNTLEKDTGWCAISQIYNRNSVAPDSLSSRTAWLYCNCNSSSYVPPLASMDETVFEESRIRDLWNKTRRIPYKSGEKKKIANMYLDESSVTVACADYGKFNGHTYSLYDACLPYKSRNDINAMKTAVSDALSVEITGWCPTEIDDDNKFVKGGLCTTTTTYSESVIPTPQPTPFPTLQPTLAPVVPTLSPTPGPTATPTTLAPTKYPTSAPTPAPTRPLYAAIHVHFLMAFQEMPNANGSKTEDGDPNVDATVAPTAGETELGNSTESTPAPSVAPLNMTNATNSTSEEETGAGTRRALSGPLVRSGGLREISFRKLQSEHVKVSDTVQALRCLMQEMVFNETIIVEAMGLSNSQSLDEPRLAYLSDDFDGSQLIPNAKVLVDTCTSFTPAQNSPLYGATVLCEVDMPVVTDTQTRYSTPQPTAFPTIAPPPTPAPTTAAPTPTIAPSTMGPSASFAPSDASNDVDNRRRFLQDEVTLAPSSPAADVNSTTSPSPTPGPTETTPETQTAAPTSPPVSAAPTSAPTASSVISLDTYLLFLFGNATNSPLFSEQRYALADGFAMLVSPSWVTQQQEETTTTTTMTSSSGSSAAIQLPYTVSGASELRDRDVESVDNDDEYHCPVNITVLQGLSTPTTPPTLQPIAPVIGAQNSLGMIVGTSLGGAALLSLVLGCCFKKRLRKLCGILSKDEEAIEDEYSKDSSMGGMGDLDVNMDELVMGPVIGMGSSGRIFKAMYCGSEVAVKEFFPRSSRGAHSGRASLSRQSTASAGEASSGGGSRQRTGHRGTAFPPRYLSNTSTVRSNSTSSNLDSSSRATTPMAANSYGAARHSVDESDAYTNSIASDRSFAPDSASAVSTGGAGVGATGSNSGLIMASTVLTPQQVPEDGLCDDGSGEEDILVGVGAGERDDVLAEVKILRRLRHPNVIRLFGCTRHMSNDTGGQRFLVVMELAACSLQDLIFRTPKSMNLSFKDFDVARKLVVASQIAAGMAYIHENNMIHFDVKCENVLLDTAGHAKICDLGIAQVTNSNDKVEAVHHQGTPAYMAPELLRDNEGITNKVDVYSYGLVLWQIMFERQPHPRTWTVPKLFYEVRYNRYRPPIDDKAGVDVALLNLMRRCWDEDPNGRPPFAQIIKELDLVISSRCVRTEVMSAAKFNVGDSVGVWDYAERRYLPAVVIELDGEGDGNALANVQLKANGEVRRGIPQVELIPKQIGMGPDGLGTLHSVGGLAILHATQAASKLPLAATKEGGEGDSTASKFGSPSIASPSSGLELNLPALQPMSLKFVAEDVAALQRASSQEGDSSKFGSGAGFKDGKAFQSGSNSALNGLASESKTFRFINETAIDLQGIRITPGGLHGEGKEPDTRVKDSLYRYMELGKGVSGTVSAALHLETFDLCAVKEIRFTNRSSRHQAVRELNALYTKLGDDGHKRCPYIVWMHEAYMDPDTQSVCLVMELMDGGSLQDLLSRFKQAARQAANNQADILSRSLLASSRKAVRGFNRLRSRQSSNDTVATHGSGTSSVKHMMNHHAHAMSPSPPPPPGPLQHRHQDLLASSSTAMASTASPPAPQGGVASSTGVVDELMLALISRSVLRALAYLHEQNFVHLDIKPANVLINSRSQVKLADFGLSKQLEKDSMANTFAGTMKYMSPERLRGEKYSFPSDIWSLGLTLLTVLLGDFPMYLIEEGSEKTVASQQLQTIGSDGKTRQASLASLSGMSSEEVNGAEPGQGSSVYWKLLERWGSGRAVEIPTELVHFSPLLEQMQRSMTPSPELRNFLSLMLALDPEARPTAAELLEHPWLRLHNSKLDLDLSTSKDDTLVMASAESSRATLQDIAFGVMSKAARNPRTRAKIGESRADSHGIVEMSISDAKINNLAAQIMLPAQVVKRSFNVAAAAHQPKRRPLVSSSSSASSNISLTKQK